MVFNNFDWLLNTFSAIKSLFGNTVTALTGSSQTEKKQLEIAQSTFDLNKTTSENNFNLAKDQFEYQKQLNQQLMDREDNAISRAFADAKNAGLSPLAVTGGAAASPLTSANAPQKDLSGINQAMGNMLSAYNDIYNRKLNRQQFALQSAVQSSQAYTQLMESKLQRKYLGLETEYLNEKLKWEINHGFRDYSLSSEIIAAVEKLLGRVNMSSVIPSIGDIVTSGNPALNLNLKSTTSNPLTPVVNLLNSVSDKHEKKELEKQEINQKKDFDKLNSGYKSIFNRAIGMLPFDKDFDKAIRDIWDYSNASDYYKDFDTFKSVIGSKKYYDRSAYLSKIGIHFKAREPLKLGQ